ncbi:hypothetical protein MBLNU230_g5923t1 [Neophaeotheca triangularis]
MARMSKRMQYLLLALAAGSIVRAQLTDLPDIGDVTATPDPEPTPTEDAATESTAEPTEESATAPPETTSEEEPSQTDAATTTADDTEAMVTATPTQSDFETTGGGSSTTGNVFHISDAPTIAGAGIPTLVIPYTADAPFMQKSTMPEGTVFIVVGAVLAFLGACVLLWRGLIAWSINRSVRKAALASIRGSEKHASVWGGGSYQPAKKNGDFYNDTNGSSMSLDHLTSAGKTSKSNPFRDPEDHRKSTQPPPNLFFSPTAEARNSVINLQSGPNAGNRSSSHLPAGYYASPGAAPPASTTLGNPHLSGSNLTPYNRNSHYSMTRGDHSPPTSSYRNSSRDRVQSTGGAGLRPPSSRDGPQRNSYIESARHGHNSLYAAPSSSSLMVGTGGTGRPTSSGAHDSDLGGSRAPSAYLEDLFENHGNGPMRGL